MKLEVAQPFYQNREWMWTHYIVREESTPAMARKAGCGHETIRCWLHKLEIPIRSRGEGHSLATRNSLTLSPKLLGLLGGELLGDGCVSMRSNYSAYYQHTSKYKEYLIWLSNQFNDLGLEQAGKINRYQTQWGAAFYYKTKSYPELVNIRQRWYPNGGKIVPKDLELTPLRARQWYIGDGCLRHHRHGHPWIIFATNGFDIGSVNYLIEELQKQGFKATRWLSDNTIYLSTYSVQDFLSWIGPCPVPCYQYKWNYAASVT